MITNFHNDLLETLQKKQETEKVLTKLFPLEKITWNDVEGNDKGVDVTVGDKKIDVKYRRKDYGNNDIALEVWSNEERGSVGWTLDETKQTDYVLWIWADTGRHELVPFKELRKVFTDNLDVWQDRYGSVSQYTRIFDDNTYRSVCVFIPLKVVWDAINTLYWDFYVRDGEWESNEHY